MTRLPLDLSDSIKTSLGSIAYGEAIVSDGSTIIPVALASYGFGAGEADSDKSGGGGGGAAIPLGIYIKDAQGVRFRPNIIALTAVATPAIAVTGIALTRIIRALRK